MSTPSQPKSPAGESTRAVHGGRPPRQAFDALTTPIVASATYAFRDTQELCDYFDGKIEREEYGRYGNPTVRAAEERLAALEGADDCALFPSGMAALTTTLLAMLRQGDHVVLTSDCYRRTRQFAGTVLARFGVTATLVAPGDTAALEAALRVPRTKLFVAESPTNPYLRVADLAALARLRDAVSPATKLLIDATFATPMNQRPLELGADLVVHSCTKYLGGHNDLLAGSVCGSRAFLAALRDFRGVLGGILDPHSAYLLLRGLKTLALRIERQNATALRLARFLEGHPRIARVYYPGLPSHPDHEVASAQMKGFGGVITFEVRGDAADAARFVDACQLATLAPSLGGVETLIEQPALMSYYELTTEQRRAIGISDSLVRLSVGIEDASDLEADLARALEAAAPLRRAATV